VTARVQGRVYRSDKPPTRPAKSGLERVKNGPDAIQMGCLRYPRKQTSVSAAAMTDPDPNPFADCDVIACYGNAGPTDVHLGSVAAGTASQYPRYFYRATLAPFCVARHGPALHQTPCPKAGPCFRIRIRPLH
jgi:hypothetical protein